MPKPRKEEAPPKAARKPARTRKTAAPKSAAVQEEQEQLEQEDAEEQFEAPGSTPVHAQEPEQQESQEEQVVEPAAEQVVASDHEEPEPVGDEPTQEEPAEEEEEPTPPEVEQPVDEEPEPDPVVEEPVDDQEEPSVAEAKKEPEPEEEIRSVVTVGRNSVDYDEQVREFYGKVINAADAAIRNEQQTDDGRRLLGMALYDLFYAVFEPIEVALMRHEVKTGAPLSFPARALRVLRDLGMPLAHPRSNNPISGWYAAVYFKTKEAIAREIEGRNKAGAKIVPFGAGLIGNSHFETSFWDRDEVAKVQKGNRLQIAEPQPFRFKASSGETLLSPQTEEAIAGEIYRYSRLTFLAIDIRDRSVLTMSFAQAETLWAKLKSEGLETLGVPPKIRAPAAPGTGRGRGRPRGSTNANAANTNTKAVLAAAAIPATSTPPAATTTPAAQQTNGAGTTTTPPPTTTAAPAGQQQQTATTTPPTSTPASSGTTPSGYTARPTGSAGTTTTPPPTTTAAPAGQQQQTATSTPPTSAPASTSGTTPSGYTARPTAGATTTPTTPAAASTEAQDGVKAIEGPTEAEEESEAVEASQEESSTPAAEEENGSTALTVIPPSTALTLIPEAVAAKIRQGQAIVTTQETILVPAEYEPIPDIAPIDWQIDNREWLDSLPEESRQTVRMVKHHDGTVTCTLLRIVSTPLLAASS